MINLFALFEDGEAASFFVFFAVVVVFIVVAIVASAKKVTEEVKRMQTQSTASASKTVKPPIRKAVEPAERMCLHDENDGHVHAGDVEEYGDIVGSLGEVNDEGCKELGGLRLIAHDSAYEQDGTVGYDLQKLGEAIVLGEIFDKPRFKK